MTHMCLIFNSGGKPWFVQPIKVLIQGKPWFVQAIKVLILPQIHAIEMIIENEPVPFSYLEHSVGLF